MLLQTTPQRTEAAGPPACSLLHLRPGAGGWPPPHQVRRKRPAGHPRAARGAGVWCHVRRLLRKISAKQIALLAGERGRLSIISWIYRRSGRSAMQEPPRFLFFSSDRIQRPWSIHLDRAGEADQVTFPVGEVADEQAFAWFLLGADRARPAEAFGLLQRDLDVGHADVKDCVALVAAPPADAARDPGAVAGRVRADEPVVTRLGDGRRDRPACVELPPEQFPVVVAEYLRVGPGDLEVH